MVELKFLNVSLFQKVYAPGMTTYRIQSGKYSPEEAAVLRNALEKMKADLETMINRSVIMPSADGSAFTLPIEFSIGNPNQPAIQIPEPKEQMPVMPNKRAKRAAPSVVPAPAPKERVVIPNLEPYKLAERPPQMPRKSVMSWSQE